MKKIVNLILALMAVFLFVTPAMADPQDFWATVYSWDGKTNSDGTPVLTRLTSGVTFKVLAIDSNTSETLVKFGSTTSLTNPVTTTNYADNSVCNDMVSFRTDPTDSANDRYVDLIVVDTNGGYTEFVENFDKYTHTIIIDERPSILHHGMIWFGPSTSETDTGVDFLATTLIQDVVVEVVTNESGKYLDVGLLSSETAGDADGLRDNILMTTAGFVKDTAIPTNGTNIDYTPVTTYGVLMAATITGSDAVATNGGTSKYSGHFVTGANAKSLTYTGVSTPTSSAGYIHYWFQRIR